MKNKIFKMTFNKTFPSYANGKYNQWSLLKIFNSNENREFFLSRKLYMRPQIDFAKGVALALNKENSVLNAISGFVNYIPEKRIMDMNPFIKQKNYSEENEFRICAETNNKNLLVLNVDKGFEDIAIPIRTKEFIDSIKYKKDSIILKKRKKEGIRYGY